VTFSTDTWGDAVDRDQVRPPGRLVQTVVSSPDQVNLIVANPPRNVAITAAKKLLGRADPELPQPTRGRATLIQPVGLRRDNPTTITAAERVMRRYDRHLERAAARLGMHRPGVVTFNPLVAGFCRLRWAGPVVYYARDDWSVHPRFEPWWPVIAEADRRLVDRGVAVAAVSEELLRRFDDRVAGIVVNNGVAAEEWETLAPTDEPPGRHGTPRLVYTGTLDDRLDQDALAEVIARWPEASVVLVGPVRTDLQRIIDQPNVHVEHPDRRSRVIELIAGADACLVPHRRTALTEAMNPLKLYEYLAAGKPVAATDLAGSRGVHDKVHLTTQGRSFAATVAAALQDGPMSEPDRRRFVAENAWPQRHADIFRFLAEVAQ
jgi:teichuronic acid biosynthesis glycosyltransferase TuaH